MSKRLSILLIAISIAGCVSAPPPATTTPVIPSPPAAVVLPEGAIQQLPSNIIWNDGPPSLPPGTKMAVLEGDPRNEGIFTVRLRVPAGSRVMPHWHPRHERVTVISGTLGLGFGTTFDNKETAAMPAGSFYVNPPMAPHYLWFPEEAVIQLTGNGPWELHYVSDESSR